jgi:hypothetical protein
MSCFQESSFPGSAGGWHVAAVKSGNTVQISPPAAAQVFVDKTIAIGFSVDNRIVFDSAKTGVVTDVVDVVELRQQRMINRGIGCLGALKMR